MVIIRRQVTMDRFQTLDISGWEAAIYGMRAPLKSYSKFDSETLCKIKNDSVFQGFSFGDKDYQLASKLVKAGPEHRKWMRQIQVWVKISMPLYWWSEFDTYKIGTSANSESTMHTLAKRNLVWEDFDTEYMDEIGKEVQVAALRRINQALVRYNITVDEIESKIAILEIEKQKEFISLKSLVTTSFIQTRYVNLNYEVLHNMYHQRKNHRLPQWSHDFVSWVEELPHSEFITEKFDN